MGFTWAKPSQPVNLGVTPPSAMPPPNVRRINEGRGGQRSVIEGPTVANYNVRVSAAGDYAGLEDSDADVFYYARPSSFHPGGVNVIYCDAHGQFLSDKIDYYVYIMLMTPRGNAVKDPYNQGALITDPGFANATTPAPKFDERWVK